jgi:hypothetical protein
MTGLMASLIVIAHENTTEKILKSKILSKSVIM